MNKVTIYTDGAYSGNHGHSSLAAIKVCGGIV